MGVDCKILLPGNVRLRDACKVIGVLVGHKRVMTEEKFLDVNGVTAKKYEIYSLVECASINIAGISGEALKWRFDKAAEAEVMYHFEPSQGNGRLLMPRSTAFWIAIGVGLVKFFGGSINYSDYKSELDLVVEAKSNDENCPENGEPWHDLQKRIFELRALVRADFVKAEEHAAYKIK